MTRCPSYSIWLAVLVGLWCSTSRFVTAEYSPKHEAHHHHKTGLCPDPATIPNANCEVTCGFDKDCGEMEKCCPGTCGTKCVKPCRMKHCHREGICPVTAYDYGKNNCPLCTCQTVNSCDSEGDLCPENTKCVKWKGKGMCKGKLGTCPALDPKQLSGQVPGQVPEQVPEPCPNECTDDFDCPRSTSKCCVNSCGGRSCSNVCMRKSCHLHCPMGFMRRNGCEICRCERSYLCEDGQRGLVRQQEMVLCDAAACPKGYFCESRADGIQHCCSCPDNPCPEDCLAGCTKDSRGCPTGICAPTIIYTCEFSKCPAGTVCVQKRKRAYCETETKGTCPVLSPSTSGLCLQSCQHDSDCAKFHKCCSNGCGKMCIAACRVPDCDVSHCQHGVELREGCPSCKCRQNPSCPDGSNALADPVSGAPIYCGRGSDRQDCPQSHFCHISATDDFAICCVGQPQLVCPRGDEPLEDMGVRLTCSLDQVSKKCPTGHFCEKAPEGSTTNPFCCACPPIDCHTICRQGVVTDPNGCPTCTCKETNVCENTLCYPGQTCVAKTINCGKESCPKKPVCKETCELAPEKGPCQVFSDRYYWHSDSKTCRKFSYGGCQGNGNNFQTVQQCQQQCNSDCPVLKCKKKCKENLYEYDVNNCPTCKCISPCSLVRCAEGYMCTEVAAKCDSPPCSRVGECVEICSLDKDKGDCKIWAPRYFWDRDLNSCELFVYGGCKGNKNNFVTKEDCVKTCGKGRCELPLDPGQCDSSMPKFYYDKTTKTCKSFEYSGCGGNANMFSSEQACSNLCVPK